MATAIEYGLVAALVGVAVIGGTIAIGNQPIPPPGVTYDATVVKVVDGDTVAVTVPAWAGTPFERESVRVYGIDTPEDRQPPAKCDAEVGKGKAAQAFARTLLKQGDQVRVGFVSIDKYGGRIDATLALPDGRDWAGLMLVGGYARPYDGGTKSDWCV